MVRQLRPWFENLGKRQVKSPKVYLRDSGLLHTLLGIESRAELLGRPQLGASWEGFAVEAMVSAAQGAEAYFWATRYRVDPRVEVVPLADAVAWAAAL